MFVSFPLSPTLSLSFLLSYSLFFVDCFFFSLSLPLSFVLSFFHSLFFNLVNIELLLRRLRLIGLPHDLVSFIWEIGDINTLSCPSKSNSNTIELTVDTSCYCGRLTAFYIQIEKYETIHIFVFKFEQSSDLFSLKNYRPCRELNLGPTRYQAC